jgi:hypothetical protein
MEEATDDLNISCGRGTGRKLNPLLRNLEVLNDVKRLRAESRENYGLATKASPLVLGLAEEPPVPPSLTNASTSARPGQQTILTNDHNVRMMQRSVSAVVAHCGYDSASRDALDTLTEALDDYAVLLTSTFARIRDAVPQHSGRDHQAAIKTLDCLLPWGRDSLRHFWNTNVAGFGLQIRDIHLRLRQKYGRKGPLAPLELPGPKTEDDVQFLTGRLGEELGIDVWGLRALGIGPNTLSDERLLLSLEGGSPVMEWSAAPTERTAQIPEASSSPLPMAIDSDEEVGRRNIPLPPAERARRFPSPTGPPVLIPPPIPPLG